MMNGWIKLHRKILYDDFYRNLTSKQKTVIITSLLLATNEKTVVKIKGEIVTLSPGEFVTSLSSLHDFCGRDLSIGSIRNTLKKAEENGFFRIHKNKNYTIISIVNWDRYQSVEKTVNNVDKKHDKYDVDSIEYKLSTLLWQLMKKNNPIAKEPNLNKWALEMDKIIRIDKRNPDIIERVIRFSQNNDFWLKNILSPQKLRKQFDTLYIQLPKEEKREVKEEGVPNGWSYF